MERDGVTKSASVYPSSCELHCEKPNREQLFNETPKWESFNYFLLWNSWYLVSDEYNDCLIKDSSTWKHVQYFGISALLAALKEIDSQT